MHCSAVRPTETQAAIPQKTGIFKDLFAAITGMLQNNPLPGISVSADEELNNLSYSEYTCPEDLILKEANITMGLMGFGVICHTILKKHHLTTAFRGLIMIPQGAFMFLSNNLSRFH